MILAALLSLDIFPNRTKLNVKSSPKYQTHTGAVLTIIVIIITLVQAITTLSGVFQYSSPQVTSQRTYNKVPGSLGLNSSNFVFAVKVGDIMYNLSQSYISFTLSAQSVIRSADGNVSLFNQRIPLKRCDLEYMKGFEADYASLGMNNALCPSTDGYDINGTYLTDNFTFLAINAQTCQNDTAQPDVICQSTEGIQASISGGISDSLRIQLLFSDTILTPSNHTTPITRFINEVYWDATPNFTTMEGDIFMNEQNIVSDDFVWFSGYNPANQTVYQFDLAELRTNFQRVQMIDANNYNIMQIVIKRSNYLYSTNRKYATIFTGLSSIGGIASLVIGIFGLVAALYSRNAYLINVANEMYEFEIPERLSNKKDSKIQPLCCFSRKKKLELSKVGLKRASTTLNKIKSETNHPQRYARISEYYLQKASKKKMTLNYGFWDFLVNIICCGRREKDKLVKRVVETVSRDTDILRLIRGAYEHERLKKVLLSKEQNDLFCQPCHPVVVTSDLWKKPESNQKISKSASMNRGVKVLQNNNSKEPFDQHSQRDCEHKQFITSCRSYQKLFRESNDPVNYKILELLDARLHESLYEMSQFVRPAPTDYNENGLRSGNKTVLLYKKSHISNKLEAAIKIAKKIKARFKERKKTKSSRIGSAFSDEKIFFNTAKEEKASLEVPKDSDIQGATSKTASQLLQLNEISFDGPKINDMPFFESHLHGKRFYLSPGI